MIGKSEEHRYSPLLRMFFEAHIQNNLLGVAMTQIKHMDKNYISYPQITI